MKKTTSKKPTPKKTVTKKTTIDTVNQTTTKKPLWPFVTVLILIALLLVFYKFGTAATVNGQPISRFRYWRRLEALDNQRTLQQMANEMIVEQEAAKQKINIEQSEIDAQIATYEAELTKQGFSLDQALEAQSLTKTDFENQVRLQKLLEKMSPAPAEVTDEEVKQYITENKDYLPKDFTVTELNNYIKEQLTIKAKNTAIEKWFTDLHDQAKIELNK